MKGKQHSQWILSTRTSSSVGALSVDVKDSKDFRTSPLNVGADER
jgi:hypothetical protein